MDTVGPGETITVVQSGIPTGQSVGYRVTKAVTGAVAIGRTTTGVVERPAGSGTYVATFVAPSEADLYLVTLDWNAGVLTPAKSVTSELQVTTSAAQIDTGLGEIADYVKTALGGDTFTALLESSNYGPSHIALAIDIIKNRVMIVPTPTADENTLPSIVLSYLGKLAALELRTAVIDLWADKAQSRSFGNDPAESLTFASRENMLKMLFDALLAAANKEAPIAIPLLPTPRLEDSSAGAAIDEEANSRVTRDPRQFPRQHEYPYRDGNVYASLSAPIEELFGP
jgi:hypothetical protein